MISVFFFYNLCSLIILIISIFSIPRKMTSQRGEDSQKPVITGNFNISLSPRDNGQLRGTRAEWISFFREEYRVALLRPTVRQHCTGNFIPADFFLLPLPFLFSLSIFFFA